MGRPNSSWCVPHNSHRLTHPDQLPAQNMARPPALLPPTTSDPLQVSLYLGSFVHDPVQYELFDLVVPPSQPPAQHADEASFHPLPEIVHTFRPEQKVPPTFVSAVSTLFLAAPWVVLLGLVRLLTLCACAERPWLILTCPSTVGTHPSAGPAPFLSKHRPLHRYARCV